MALTSLSTGGTIAGVVDVVVVVVVVVGEEVQWLQPLPVRDTYSNITQLTELQVICMLRGRGPW